MFFKRNEFIEFTDKIMRRNRVPILIHYKQWRQLFLDNKNKYIEDLSKELEELLKEESGLGKKLKDCQHEKRILMNKIIHLSDRLNVRGEQVDMTDIESSKNEILLLNEEIDKTREELEIHVQKIEDINMELLEKTVKTAYSEIDRAETRMGIVDNEISLLREKIGGYWDEKETLEQRIQALYSLLHSVVGLREIEKLDKEFLKNRKKDD